jgi:hypothetical protein
MIEEALMHVGAGDILKEMNLFPSKIRDFLNELYLS